MQQHAITFRTSRQLVVLVFPLRSSVGVGMFFIPAFIIRPFSHQTARALALGDGVPPARAIGQLSLRCLISCTSVGLILWNVATVA